MPHSKQIYSRQGTSAAFFVIICLGATQAARAADPVAYVSANTQDYITLVDPTTGKAARLAPANTNATSFVVSPNGTTAYVARYSAYVSSVLGSTLLA